MFISYETIVPSACWAKPVIYLYPESKTDIKVTLDWNKRLLTSIPLYINDWQVTSDEFGNIYDKKTQKYYPYLFWEDLLTYKTPEKWFVVKKDEVWDFLNNKLEYIWLNNKEINDFVEFWLPKMQESNYYFITFLQNDILDKIAPITIIPKPDNIWRIFMDFKWLDEYKNVEELTLNKINRDWFDAIEWWGKLR